MIKVRDVTQKDIPGMAKLWLEMMDYHIKIDPFFYSQDKNTVQSYKKFLNKEIKDKNSKYIIAEINKTIIGHIGGRIEDRPPDLAIKKNGFILEATVTKKYRKKGIGKKLTNELLKWFKSKKMKFVMLRTHSKNTSSIKAWEKIGFKENLKLMIKKI